MSPEKKVQSLQWPKSTTVKLLINTMSSTNSSTSSIVCSMRRMDNTLFTNKWRRRMSPEKKVQSLQWPRSTTAKPEWRVRLRTANTSPTLSTSRSTTTWGRKTKQMCT